MRMRADPLARNRMHGSLRPVPKSDQARGSASSTTRAAATCFVPMPTAVRGAIVASEHTSRAGTFAEKVLVVCGPS
jgi:hypothetical protein